MTRAQGIGVVLLGAVVASVGCSSSKSDDPQANAGSGGTAGVSAAGGEAHGGAAHAGAGGTGHAGAGQGGGSSGGSGDGGNAGAANHGGTGSDAGAAGDSSIACLPSNDHCPAGQYCSPDSSQCVAGCKDATSCASGVCDEHHDCQNCIRDDECSAGKVCGNNQCAPACTVAQEGGSTGCGAGLTCCSLHCIDETSDAAHCGACGIGCNSSSFCGSASCATATLSSVCTIAKVAVVIDAAEPDNTAARQIAAALAASCPGAPTTREISQDSMTVNGVANTSTGQPVSGGDELLVVAGGFYFARVMNYVEMKSVAPLYAHSAGGLYQYRLHADDSVAVSFPDAEDPADEYFVLQLIRDSSSGSLLLNAQGFFPASTQLAASYFSTVLLPKLDTLDKSWYAYEWKDTNANQTIDAGEVMLLKSG